MKIGTKNRTSQLAVASVVCTVGLVLAMGTPALALTYSTQYEMGFDPSTSAGVLDASGADVNGNGLLTVGAAGTGSTFAAGIMHFIDNTGSGNFGYYFNQATTADLVFTVDMRVKANNNVNATADARSVAFNGGRTVTPNAAKGRGLRLNSVGSCTNGSAQLTSGASGEACMDLSTFRRLRVVVDGVNSVITVYDLDAGGAAVLTSSTVGDGGVASEISNGGFQIGSLSGGITTATDFEVDYFRVLLGTAVNDSTTVINQITPPSCLVAVTPIGAQSSTGYELGATPPPSSVVHNINNLGSTTINYTVTEINSAGVPFDYPWLSLSSTSGSVAGSSNTAITSTLSTTSLAAGVYTAYLKFTDNCPTSTCAEPFTYANSALVGNPGWTGSAQANDIQVLSNEIKISADNGGDAGDVNAIHNVSCSPDGDGIISVKIDARQGSGSSFIWDVQAMDGPDGTGNILGWWRGNGTFVRARTSVNATFGDYTLLAGYTELEMRINTLSNTTEYLGGGSTVATLLHPPTGGSSVASVRIVRLSRDDVPTDFVFLDDLEVSVLDQRYRTVNLTVVGCSIEVQEPRIRYVGPCKLTETTTEVFTIKNNGSVDWTGFQANEITDDDDWMTVTYTSSPVVRFATATVNATINWGQVPITSGGDDQASRIQFGATCNGGSSFVFDTPSLGGGIETVNVMDNVVAPMKLLYNGDVSPSANDSAGTGFRFELFDSSVEQGAVVSDSGLGQASDGLAYQITDLGGTGLKTKWRSVLNGGTPGPNIDSKSGATALARVKVTSATGSTNGNLMILETTIGGSYHWGGANNVVREVQRGDSAVVSGDGAYHIIRITTKDTQLVGTGIVVNLYLDENPTPVLTITNASANDGGNSGLDAIGFGTTSSTDAQTIYFDWVTGTNAGAFAPGEEVPCIGSLIPASNCNVPRVDADNDDDVDMDDFAVFQTCYTGPLVSPPPLSQLCDCFDNDNDNDVDVADFTAFVNCETGANVPWVTSGSCPN